MVVSGTVIAGAFTAFLWWSDPTSFSTPSKRLIELEDRVETDSDRGIAVFAFGDFGALSSDTLQTSGAPWKLMVAALALKETGGNADEVATVDLAAIFRRFGFHSPSTIENWPAHLGPPDLSAPLGLNIGYASHEIWPIGVTIANSGCAACHSSVVYGSDGQPDTSRVWLGTPNGSINLQAYAEDVFAALLAYSGDAKRLMRAVDHLFPETSWQEKVTLRLVVLPMIEAELAERNAKLGKLQPFSGGLPGATNGLNALEYRLGLIAPDELVAESVFNSVPDLGGRVWRTGFLNTHTYAVPGAARLPETTETDIDSDHLADLAAIIAYFTVPSMGVTEAVAEAHIDDAVDVATWMKSYEPQPFPGEIDTDLLPKGRAVFAQACSECHGAYDSNLENPSLLSFPNWLGDVGTDLARVELSGTDLANAVNGSAYGRYISAQAAEGYIAPPLSGIWSSAPYLHNGSVPTLWHLMHPETRPDRFVVGGHALDLDRLGIAGVDDGVGGWMPPEGHVPWSISAEINTDDFGLGNEGHEAEFEALSAADRAALMEYLKLL